MNKKPKAIAAQIAAEIWYKLAVGAFGDGSFKSVVAEEICKAEQRGRERALAELSSMLQSMAPKQVKK